METNIVFKSNLYILLEDISCPYKDPTFVANVFDPMKLRRLREKKSQYPYIRFTPLQEKYGDAGAICLNTARYLKNREKLPQYWVLRKTKTGWKDTCRCLLTQCCSFDKCRPGEKEKAENETEARNKFKRPEQSEPIKGYPVILNLIRIFERHGDSAFEIVENTNIHQRDDRDGKKQPFAVLEQSNQKRLASDQTTQAFPIIENKDIGQRLERIKGRITKRDYDGNHSFENFDLGTDDRNFNANLLPGRIEYNPLTTSSEIKEKNQMLEIERRNTDNDDNEFFRQFRK